MVKKIRKASGRTKIIILTKAVIKTTALFTFNLCCVVFLNVFSCEYAVQKNCSYCNASPPLRQGYLSQSCTEAVGWMLYVPNQCITIYALLWTLLVHIFRNFTRSLYFVLVSLFLSYTFFMWHFSHVVFFFMLHLFHVAFSSLLQFFLVPLFSWFTLSATFHVFFLLLYFMLHSFRSALSSCCIIFMMHSFHASLFRCCTRPRNFSKMGSTKKKVIVSYCPPFASGKTLPKAMHIFTQAELLPNFIPSHNNSVSVHLFPDLEPQLIKSK